MSEDTFIKVRGIVIAMLLLCLSLILWRGHWLEMLNWMFWGVCGMGAGGILFGIYTFFRRERT